MKVELQGTSFDRTSRSGIGIPEVWVRGKTWMRDDNALLDKCTDHQHFADLDRQDGLRRAKRLFRIEREIELR